MTRSYEKQGCHRYNRTGRHPGRALTSLATVSRFVAFIFTLASSAWAISRTEKDGAFFAHASISL